MLFWKNWKEGRNGWGLNKKDMYTAWKEKRTDEQETSRKSETMKESHIKRQKIGEG